VQDCTARVRMGREPPARQQQIPFGLGRDVGAVRELSAKPELPGCWATIPPATEEAPSQCDSPRPKVLFFALPYHGANKYLILEASLNGKQRRKRSCRTGRVVD